MRREGQKLLLTRDVFSSYTTGAILKNESHLELRRGLLSTTNLLHQSECIVRVDNATGFQKLKDDPVLSQHNITLEFGCVKNVNKVAVADKCIQEFEIELLKLDPTWKQIMTEILMTH